MRSCEIVAYEPDRQAKWQELYEAFLQHTQLMPVE